jgi:hypothetical protein
MLDLLNLSVRLITQQAFFAKAFLSSQYGICHVILVFARRCGGGMGASSQKKVVSRSGAADFI